MIQLSTPIQTASPIQNVVNETEGSQIEDLPDHLGQVAEKKNGPGIFAKLLESLSAKGKAAESEGAENAGDKLPPEAANTPNRLLPEGPGLSIEQTLEQANGLLLEQTIGLPIDQSIEQSIAPLIEPDIWLEAQMPPMLEDSESINGGLRIMEKLFSQDRQVEQVEDEGVSKGGELVHQGGFPREMTQKDEGPVEGELSALPIFAEEAEEGQFFEAEANEDIAKLAAKKAKVPNFAVASSGQTESGISQAKYQVDQASLGVKPAGENGKGANSAESRKKGKERINVEFLDLRTEGPTETGNARGVGLSPQGQAPLKPELEISVDLNPKTANSEAGRADGETYQGRAFEDALARELRGDLSVDIVRDATIIARNGGEGSIRLTLHPASLGNVKVRLEMAENKITALIVVESDEALKAFQRELPVLEKAFRDSGFSEANLEMSLAQDGRNYGGEERQERDFSAFAPVMAASRYEADSGLVENWLPVQGEAALSAWPERIPVNLLV